MARSARVQFPGAVYHISARGNHQENIYFSDQDRELFIRLLAAAGSLGSDLIFSDYKTLSVKKPEDVLSLIHI